MKCKWCNMEVQGNSQFCPYCGNSLTDNNINQNQQYYQNQGYVNAPVKDEANVGFAILSFFIPLAGLIIYLIKKDNEPKTAKVSGICALVSFGLNMLLVILVFGFTFFTTKNVINSAVNSMQDNVIDSSNEIIDKEENDDNNPVINENDPQSNINNSNDWKKYEVVVNNTTITIPTTYSALKDATGFQMKSSEENSYLEDGYYTILNLYKNDKTALYVEVLNDSGANALYTDCKITRISQTSYQVSQGADIVYFPGGLKAGDEITESKLIELLGTPYDKREYSDEGYKSITYKYCEDDSWTTTNMYEIRVVNGIIDELQLDHRN